MLLPVVQFFHILIAATWAGGSLILGLVVLPALARMPADQARPVWDKLVPRAGAILGATGGLTYLIGMLRAWLGGGISTLGDILSGYGLAVIAAIIVMTVFEAIGGRMRRRFAARLEAPAQHEAEALGDAMRVGLIQLALLLVIIALMVTMAFGFV